MGSLRSYPNSNPVLGRARRDQWMLAFKIQKPQGALCNGIICLRAILLDPSSFKIVYQNNKVSSDSFSLRKSLTFLPKAGGEHVGITSQVYLRELGFELKLKSESLLVPWCAQPTNRIGQRHIKR